MFNKYWRTYPWPIQLLQFIVMVAIMASFFAFTVPLLLYKQMHISTEAILTLSDQSPRRIINAMLVGQIFSSAGLFLLPALLFAYATHPKPFF